VQNKPRMKSKNNTNFVRNSLLKQDAFQNNSEVSSLRIFNGNPQTNGFALL
jgi:hypothetical protein